MKKLQKLAIVFTAFVFSFFSCAQITDPVNVNTNETTKFGSKQITITVASSEDIVKFETNSNARTILPNALKGNDLKYYLWDESDTNPASVTFDAKAGSETEGSITTSFDVKAYTLTLAAVTNDYSGDVTKDALKTNALLLATTTVDFHYTDKVHFYLTPNKFGTNGSVNLTLQGIGDWVYDDISAISACMYSKGSNTPLTDSEQVVTKDDFKTGSFNYTYTENLTPAEYIFEMTFTANEKEFKWNDNLVVLPNQTTTKTVQIPNIIGKKPDAPTDFIAGYTIPEDNTDEYYTVTLNWTDVANNEFYYDLEVIELSAIPADDTTWSDDIWDTLDNTSPTKRYSGVEEENVRTLWQKSPNCIIYKDGSLFRNSTNIKMQLLLGSLHFARIRTVNAVGESDWVYLDLNNNPTDTNKFTSEVINLFKVSYDLRGGTIAPATELTSYYNAGTEVTIIKPKTSATDTESTITVTLGEKYWQKWTTADGVVFEHEEYNSFKNLELFASYIDPMSDVTILRPQDYELLKTKVKVEVGTNEITAEYDTYTYNITDGDLTVSYSLSDTPNYDKFKFIISSPVNKYFTQEKNGEVSGSDSEKKASATFASNEICPGTYILQIVAYIDGTAYTTWSVLNVIEQ